MPKRNTTTWRLSAAAMAAALVLFHGTTASEAVSPVSSVPPSRTAVLAELRSAIHNAAAPSASLDLGGGRAFETTTTTKSDDCGSTTTTNSRFTVGGGAGQGKPGCAGGGSAAAGTTPTTVDGRLPPARATVSSPLAASAPAAPAMPSVPGPEPASASGKTRAGEQEFDATKTVPSAGCGSGDPAACKKLTSAANAVASIDSWIRNFRKNNRVDPRSVAEEVMEPMVESLRRRNRAAEQAIAEDQALQREELTEELARHSLRQIEYEASHPPKIQPREQDGRSLFAKLHDIMTGRDEERKAAARKAANDE